MSGLHLTPMLTASSDSWIRLRSRQTPRLFQGLSEPPCRSEVRVYGSFPLVVGRNGDG